MDVIAIHDLPDVVVDEVGTERRQVEPGRDQRDGEPDEKRPDKPRARLRRRAPRMTRPGS